LKDNAAANNRDGNSATHRTATNYWRLPIEFTCPAESLREPVAS